MQRYNFSIENLTKHHENGLIVANVRFEFFEDLLNDGYDVSHHVDVRVRILNNDDCTLAELHEILLQKAVDQLRHALSICENKNAKEILLHQS